LCNVVLLIDEAAQLYDTFTGFNLDFACFHIVIRGEGGFDARGDDAVIHGFRNGNIVIEGGTSDHGHHTQSRCKY
jgi:hypothetical protein